MKKKYPTIKFVTCNLSLNYVLFEISSSRYLTFPVLRTSTMSFESEESIATPVRKHFTSGIYIFFMNIKINMEKNYLPAES